MNTRELEELRVEELRDLISKIKEIISFAEKHYVQENKKKSREVNLAVLSAIKEIKDELSGSYANADLIGNIVSRMSVVIYSKKYESILDSKKSILKNSLDEIIKETKNAIKESKENDDIKKGPRGGKVKLIDSFTSLSDENESDSKDEQIEGFKFSESYSKYAQNYSESHDDRDLDDIFLEATMNDRKNIISPVDEFDFEESEPEEPEPEAPQEAKGIGEVDHSSNEKQTYTLEELLKIVNQHLEDIKARQKEAKAKEYESDITMKIEKEFDDLSPLVVTTFRYLKEAEKNNSKTYEFLHALDILDTKIKNTLYSLDPKDQSYVSGDQFALFYSILMKKLFTEEDFEPFGSGVKKYLASLREALTQYPESQENFKDISKIARANMLPEHDEDFANQVFIRSLYLSASIERFSGSVGCDNITAKAIIVPLKSKLITEYFNERYEPEERSITIHRRERETNKVLLNDLERRINEAVANIQGMLNSDDGVKSETPVQEESPPSIDWMDLPLSTSPPSSSSSTTAQVMGSISCREDRLKAEVSKLHDTNHPSNIGDLGEEEQPLELEINSKKQHETATMKVQTKKTIRGF